MKFSYLVPWPDQVSAEREFGYRLMSAASSLGHECLLISSADANRTPVSSRKDKFGNFIVLPHFTQPKIEGIDCVAALWNSPFTVNKYPQGPVNVTSADYFLDGGSARTNEYFERISTTKVISNLYPSANDLKIPGKISPESTLFYSGINWEKLTGQKSRHSEILELLDLGKLISIYGPREIQGVKVWEEFENYIDEIACDGDSIVREANKHGVSLALLNEDHVNWGFAPMRISEAFAAHNALIVDEHPIIMEFSELVDIIPRGLGPSKKAHFIGEKLADIRRDPEYASFRAEEAASKWFSKYSLEIQLAHLIKQISKQKIEVSQTLDAPITLDWHQATYLNDLHDEITVRGDKIIFHSGLKIESQKEIEKFFDDNPETCFAIGVVEISDNEQFSLHSGLERDLNAPGSWFAVESLALNAKKLRPHADSLFELDSKRFFENLILGHYGAGQMLPITVAKISASNRRRVHVDLLTNFGVLNPGRIVSERAQYDSRESLHLNLKRRIVNKLPKQIRKGLNSAYVNLISLLRTIKRND